MSFWDLPVRRLSSTDVYDLITGSDEGHRLELKSFAMKGEQTEAITKALTAMANTDGGRVIWGVSDHGDGIEQSRWRPHTGTRAQTEQRARNALVACSPPV